MENCAQIKTFLKNCVTKFNKKIQGVAMFM
jgi:hypothetical protein